MIIDVMVMMMIVARLSNCFPRWLLGRDRPESAALGGALAGLASINYRFLFPYSSSRGLSAAGFCVFLFEPTTFDGLRGCLRYNAM